MTSLGPAQVELTISRKDATMTMERRVGNRVQTFIYRLDGSESVSEAGTLTRRARSRWNGPRLVTEGTHTITTPGSEVSIGFTETIELDADGVLHIETTREAQPPTRQTYTGKTGRRVAQRASTGSTSDGRHH